MSESMKHMEAGMTGFFRRALNVLPESFQTVMPLKRAHRADLPDAVRELSALLTTERAELSRPYWSSPRFVSAYLRYFLPWNLLRLNRLMRGLTLPNPADAGTAGPVMVDLGSGPLSFPMALWLTSEAWRKTPVRLVCVDSAPRPLELGRAIFQDMAARLNEPLLWDIRLERAPLLRGLRDLPDRPLLITAGNVLNEWQGQQKNSDAPLSERLSEVAESVSRVLQPSGQALMVEPGTRLGGTLTATLREVALESGLHPLAPCTHAEPCPLLGRRERGWCHVHYEDDPEATEWLASLARAAELAKHGLSLSYLQLSAQAPERIPTLARIISQPMAVPGKGLARYGCAAAGLVLIARSRHVPSGASTEISLTGDRDARSAALGAEVTGAPAPSPQTRVSEPFRPPFRRSDDRPFQKADRASDDRPERSDRSDRPERSDRSERPRADRNDRSERPRTDRPDRSDRSARPERPDRPDRSTRKPEQKPDRKSGRKSGPSGGPRQDRRSGRQK